MTMTNALADGLKEDHEWDRTWTDVFNQYQRDLRHAHYIHAFCRPQDRVLEIAAGSFRDVAMLNRLGIDCHGMDYSGEAVSRTIGEYPDLKDKATKMDAFALTYGDKAFDVSYHNGFWGLFGDEDMARLAREQATVSRRLMIATVHNGHNADFVDYFARVSQTDPLYRIRFFTVDEITDIMKTVARNVTVIPVGKGKKSHEDELINRGKTDPAILKRYFDRCGHKFLEQSERLLCIGEL
ncbi:class I SAM-dependent methyltransferase [Neorhizobium sp. NPDC001467]|uniref:class I SAM-dependent methyltransferase n=1 Tax=Neorhizobium sp. NPDC001467 TaxID=3390595 RepID=UPI003D0852FF